MPRYRTVDFSLDAGWKGDEIEARLSIVFARVRVGQRGIMVKTAVFAGCTGASFFVRCRQGEVVRHTEGTVIEVKYSHSNETDKTVAVDPHLKSTFEGGGKVDISILGWIRTTKEAGTATFRYDEQPLVATRALDRKGVQWSFDLPRGPKAVRFAAEGNMELVGGFKCGKRPCGTISAGAIPSNRCLFDSHLRPLGPIASLGLWAKLHAAGVSLPPFDRIVHSEEV